MQNKSRAFTLIELLVVVLIIGILAAVAVPQYRFAIARARVTQLVTLAQTIITAENSYYLANGVYTEDWTQLDINFPGTPSSERDFEGNNWGAQLNKTSRWVALRDKRISGLRLYFLFSGTRKCYALQEDEQANQLCQNLTHKKSRWSDGNWFSYIF